MKVFIKALGKVALLVLPLGWLSCGGGKTKCATCAVAIEIQIIFFCAVAVF